MPPAINPALYNALVRRLGAVKISNPGEQARVTHRPDWSRGKPRQSVHAEGGEHYYVDCPFCPDNRGRLSFSHLWATQDVQTGQKLLHLVHCFNENCIDSRLQQEMLFDMVFPLGGCRRMPASNVAVLRDESCPVVPPARIDLPKNCVPLADLPVEHSARTYLVQRGFDAEELSERWQISFCHRNETERPTFRQRIVVPIYRQGPTTVDGGGQSTWRLAGWQARAIASELGRVPKYLTSAGLHKSRLLYGLPQITEGDGPIVLVEGPTDVWRLGRDSVAILGKDFSPYQRRLLLDLADGRPIVVAFDRDAAVDAQRVRDILLGERRRTQDDGHVVVLELPAGRDDIGECSRQEAWTAVNRSLGAPSGTVPRGQTAAGVAFDLVDGRRMTLSSSALARIGDSIVVVYSEVGILDGEMSLAFVGEDKRGRGVVAGADRFIGQLRTRKRVHFNSVADGLIERRYGLPAADDFEDVRLIYKLLGEDVPQDLAALIKRSVAPDRFSNHPAGREHLRQTLGNLIEVALQLHQIWSEGHLLRRLHDEGLDFVYEQIEKPIVAPCISMMRNGLHVDTLRLEGIVSDAGEQLHQLQNEVDRLAGGRVNVMSTKELGAVLHERLGLSVLRRTPQGLPSTKAESLRELCSHHPIVPLILEFRNLHGVHQFGIQLQHATDSTTQRVHCRHDPMGAPTGRISCSQPNMQAVPHRLREVFTAEPGHDLVELDFSQFELRVLAEVTQSPELISAFQRGIDLHGATAAHVLRISEGDVTHAEREIGKIVNFAILNGQSASRMAKSLGTTRRNAQHHIDGFFSAYAGVDRWIEETQRIAREEGFVRTMFGRRIYLDEIISDDPAASGRTLRQAVNAVIQGTAADIHKMALSRLFSALPDDCRILLTVHDSILLEVPIYRTSEVLELAPRVLVEAPDGFAVPLDVKVGSGPDWLRCAPQVSTTTTR